MIPETMNELRAYVGELRNSPLLLPKDVDRTRLVCTPMDTEWKNRISDCWWFTGKLDAFENISSTLQMHLSKLLSLREKLLLAGGEAVCLPVYDNDADNLLEFGQFWYGSNAQKRRGRPCGCHANAAAIWSGNKEDMRICTGYALSVDGMWRQHSWVIWLKPEGNVIIETTEPRLCYYGFAMNSALCKAFARVNI